MSTEVARRARIGESASAALRKAFMSRQKARLLAVALALLGAIAAALLVELVGRRAEALPAPTASHAAPSPTAQEELDRETPRRSLEGFLREGREGDFGVAANYLDLNGVP